MKDLAEIERKALDKMTDFAKEYCQKAFKGTADETFQAYKRYLIKPRVMRDITVRDLSTTILGHPISFPVCVSPTAKHLLTHEEGEIATARGAHKAGVAFTLSLFTNKSQDQIAKAVPDGLNFFALLFLKDRSVMVQLVREAEKCGFKALVLTVDQPGLVERTVTPMHYYRNEDWYIRGAFKCVDKCVTEDGRQVPYTHAYLAPQFDASATWDDVNWLTKHTKLPVIAKGILSESDAVQAVEAGVSGILVSNHGGRQLDGVTATLDALPGIVQAVNGRCEVYVDGGIRHGSDVYKALALGAKVVFIGRPALYGLAYNGSAGVEEVLDILRKELDTTMALTGCSRLADIGPDLLVKKPALYSRI